MMEASSKSQVPFGCGSLFSVFFKIGLFTFGGGYAMIPLIHREMVERRGWIGDQEIVDVLALAQSVPGAVAINAATLIGRRLRGTMGALAATAGVILPSFVIITLIAAFFSRFQDSPIAQAAFRGLRPAVAALLVLAVWKVGKSSVRDGLGWLLAVSATFLVVVLRLHALYAIVGAAVLGIVLHVAVPKWMNRLMANDRKLQPDEDRNLDETPLIASQLEDKPGCSSSDAPAGPLIASQLADKPGCVHADAPARPLIASQLADRGKKK